MLQKVVVVLSVLVLTSPGVAGAHKRECQGPRHHQLCAGQRVKIGDRWLTIHCFGARGHRICAI